MLSPDTGYLALDEREAEICGFDVRGCFGMTKAFVCFSKERSLQSAEISGKSRFLLFSRKMVMSMACCWAAVRLLGAIILFDSGQMTCDSFKSSGLEELDAVDDDFSSSVALPEILAWFFGWAEDEEDFSVDGFAGTRKAKFCVKFMLHNSKSQ